MNKKRNFHRPKRNKAPYTPPYSAELMAKSVTDLNLTKRTLDALTAGKVLTLHDIAVRTMREMYKIQNFGKKNLEDVKRAIAPLGVDFKPEEERPSEDPTVQLTMLSQRPPKQKEPPKPTKPPRPTEPGAPEEWTKFSQNGKWGIKNLLGKTVIPAVYDEIFKFKEELACFEQRGKFGYLNPSNEIVIQPTYECAMSFSEGLASVALNNKTGYIDKTGTVVIDYQYDAGTAFVEGMARVKTDGKWLIIDNTGNVIKDNL